MFPVMSSDCTAGALDLGGDCLTGSLTRGGRLLGEEKKIPLRGCFDFWIPFCGVPGVRCRLRLGDDLRGDLGDRRFG
jgi:hypothetical protein